VRADEKLTAFLELERAVCIHVLTEENLANGDRSLLPWGFNRNPRAVGPSGPCVGA